MTSRGFFAVSGIVQCCNAGINVVRYIKKYVILFIWLKNKGRVWGKNTEIRNLQSTVDGNTGLQDNALLIQALDLPLMQL